MCLWLCLAAVQPPPAPAAEPPADLTAHLGKIAAAIRDAAAWKLEAVESWTISDEGEKSQGTNRYFLAVKDPGSFAIRAWNEDVKRPSVAAVCDGTTLTTRVTDPKPIHALSKPRAPAESLHRNPIVAAVFGPPMIDLFIRPDFAEYLAGALVGPRDLGIVERDGKSYRHLRAGWGDGRLVELWLDPEGSSLPRFLRWTRTLAPEEAGKESFRLVSDVTLTWTLDAELPDETFVVDMPEDSRLVDDLYATLTDSGQALAVGKPLPPLALKLLGGEPLDLASHVGKDVVVLNFWATWDPAGLESLPTLAQFAAEYAPKGVVIYHVNLGEDEEVVADHLAKSNEALLVALDPEGKASEACAIRGLPFSIVLGKDGMIRSVNAGELRGFRERFRAQLDATLEGKP